MFYEVMFQLIAKRGRFNTGTQFKAGLILDHKLLQPTHEHKFKKGAKYIVHFTLTDILAKQVVLY